MHGEEVIVCKGNRMPLPVPISWNRRKNQELRAKRKAYTGYHKSKEDGKVHHNIIRQPRKMGLPCNSQKCLKSKNRQCHIFDEEVRQFIFDDYGTFS